MERERSRARGAESERARERQDLSPPTAEPADSSLLLLGQHASTFVLRSGSLTIGSSWVGLLAVVFGVEVFGVEVFGVEVFGVEGESGDERNLNFKLWGRRALVNARQATGRRSVWQAGRQSRAGARYTAPVKQAQRPRHIQFSD